MRAFLIDPYESEITEVVFSGKYTHIYELIGQDCFDTVRINREGDVVYVDDMGLSRPDQRFFRLDSYPQPLAGKGLVLGVDYDGDSVAPKISLSELKRIVSWVRPDLRFVGEQTTEGEEDHPIFGKVRTIRRTPIFKVGDVRSPHDDD